MRDNIKLMIVVGIIVLILGGSIAWSALDFSTVNPDHVTGNTAGNLYNGGYICEYNGVVYFTYPQKSFGLYRMNADGKIRSMNISSAFSLNIYGDYLYYVRDQYKSGVRSFLSGFPYGTFKTSLRTSRSTSLSTNQSSFLCLSGNDIIYQALTKDGNFMTRTGIQKDEPEIQVKGADYRLASVDAGYLYFAETNLNHNIYRYHIPTNSTELFYEGNYYQPIYLNGFLYVIDVEDDYSLKKVNVSTGEVVVLAEDSVINYNTDGRMVYYEYENGDEEEYGLYRCDVYGENRMQITDYPCMNIHMTTDYIYFMRFKDNFTWYRTSLDGEVDVQIFAPE